MAYNPYRWYTEGKYRNKPLRKSEPLLLKIQNGDFDVSPFFKEAGDNEKLYQEKYNEFMESSYLENIEERKTEAHRFARMKRIKANKLKEKGLEEEFNRLIQLREELKTEFGKDLWDKAMQRQRGKGTTEDLYWWYKNQCKVMYTKSELKIKGINLKI